MAVTPEINYLALGDSYTIGEAVPAEENFPNQVYRIVKETGVTIHPPRIIAKTGWTTDELQAGIRESNESDPLKMKYDFVTLLIGVNNQYRGWPLEKYREEFEGLLKQAILFAGGKRENVIVVSIPDWGVTPFAEGRDRAGIAEQIDLFNAANKAIAERYNIYYINITPWTKEAGADKSLLASDGLHPSGKEYMRWAEIIAKKMLNTG
jgi:lysophospholipase L1-like esterase